MNPNDMRDKKVEKANDNETELEVDSDIDWQYWINLPFLTEVEIAALTLGVNPDRFDDTSFKSISPDDSIYYKLKLRERLVDRAIKSKNLRKNPHLKYVLMWINTFNIPCSPEFNTQSKHFKASKNYRKLYLNYKNKYKELKEETDEISGNAGKRLKSIHEIIYALAWGVFEFSDGNNPATKKIHGLVTDAGFKMTEQAVRAQLNAAHNYLYDKKKLPQGLYHLFYPNPIKRNDLS